MTARHTPSIAFRPPGTGKDAETSAWSLAASMKGAEPGPAAEVKVSLLPASCTTSCSHVHDDAILSQASRRTVTNRE